MKKLGVFLFLICFIQAFSFAGAYIYLYVDGEEADYVNTEVGQVVTVRVYVEFTGSTVTSGVGIHIDFDETYMRVLDQLPPADMPTTDNTIFHPFQKGTFFSNVMHYYNGIWQDNENYDLGKLVYERQIQQTAQEHSGWGYLCKFQILAQEPVTNALIKVNSTYTNFTHYFYRDGQGNLRDAPFINQAEAYFYLTIEGNTPVPNPVETSINMENQNLVLSWTKDVNATGYRIYTDTYPFFDIGTADLMQTVPNSDDDIISYMITQPGIIGDPAINHFFTLTSYNNQGESEAGSYVGEIDFEIQTTDETDLNAISIPFENPLYGTTEELCDEISVAETVSKWNETDQTYTTYIKALNINSYTLDPGEFYFVGAKRDTIWTSYGTVPEPGAFDFTLVNNIEQGVTDINALSLPLFLSGISSASDFGAGTYQIPDLETVIKWQSGGQSFNTHIIGLPSTDFEVIPGYPYMIGVGENANGQVWPEFE